MRTYRIPLLLCAVLSLGSASQALAPKPQTLHYEVRLKSASFGDMGTRKMYIKDNNMRWEGKVDKFPLLVIKNAQGTFIVNPVQKVIGQYPKDSNRNNPRVYLPGPTGPTKAFLTQLKAVKCGQEKVARQMCDVYSYHEPSSQRNCRLWVGVASGKPVKLVLLGKEKTNDTVVATYTKYVIGERIPDSVFALPKNHAIRPMPKRSLASRTTPDSNPRSPI